MAKVVTIQTISDDPNGIKIIGLGAKSLKTFVVPRSMVSEIKNRDDANTPGVYFLFGENEAGSTVYIGQSANIINRINDHDRGKSDELWNIAVLFSLETIYIRYLEDNAVRQAKEAKRYDVKNIAGAPGEKINESQRIIGEEYFEDMKFILGILGYPLFQDSPKEKQAEEVYFIEDANNKDAMGRGSLLPNQEFIVFKDSLARVKETKGFIEHVRSSVALRSQLVSEGVLKILENGKSYIFTKDYVFSSPSAAADVVVARACNGWTGWKNKEGKTLDENTRGPGKYDMFFSIFEKEFSKITPEYQNDISFSQYSRKNYKQIKFPGYGRKHFEVRFVKGESAIEIALHNEPAGVNDYYLRDFFNKNKESVQKEIGNNVKYEEWGDHWERIFILVPIESNQNLDDQLALRISKTMRDFVGCIHPLIK